MRSWHNARYLVQCKSNLEEKYDCGGISKEDYCKIEAIYMADEEED